MKLIEFLSIKTGSKSVTRRLLLQGGVFLNGERLFSIVDLDINLVEGDIVQAGNAGFYEYKESKYGAGNQD